MKKKYGLVLEGGALRGLFSAGVLDTFAENDIKFPYAVGVSAGACNLMSFVSGQKGRSKLTMTHEGHESFYGAEAFKRSKKVLDLDIIFNEYTYDYYPFDFKSYFESDTECEFVLTNLESGRAEYFNNINDEKKLLDTVRASCSLPILSDPVEINGELYLDGGIAEPVPVKHAFLSGCRKCVVILTKPDGYEAKQPINVSAAMSVLYRKHPELLEAYQRRQRVYRSRMILLSYLERAGMAYVIRPTVPTINRLESDPLKLEGYYQNGVEVAQNSLETLRAFLKL